MRRFEYLILERITDAKYEMSEVQWLNYQGDHGWELVNICLLITRPIAIYHFKREKP